MTEGHLFNISKQFLPTHPSYQTYSFVHHTASSHHPDFYSSAKSHPLYRIRHTLPHIAAFILCHLVQPNPSQAYPALSTNTQQPQQRKALLCRAMRPTIPSYLHIYPFIQSSIDALNHSEHLQAIQDNTMYPPSTLKQLVGHSAQSTNANARRQPRSASTVAVVDTVNPNTENSDAGLYTCVILHDRFNALMLVNARTEGASQTVCPDHRIGQSRRTAWIYSMDRQRERAVT